jgi:hypothetical protein
MMKATLPDMLSVGTAYVRGCNGCSWRCNAHVFADGKRCNYRVRVVPSASALPPVRLQRVHIGRGLG